MLETYSRRVEYKQFQQYSVSQDPYAVRGGIGERSLRQILEHAVEVAERGLPNDRDAIKKLVSEITTMVDALCELRDDGKGTSPQVRLISYLILSSDKNFKFLISFRPKA